jgi:hypothetical protein
MCDFVAHKSGEGDIVCPWGEGGGVLDENNREAADDPREDEAIRAALRIAGETGDHFLIALPRELAARGCRYEVVARIEEVLKTPRGGGCGSKSTN